MIKIAVLETWEVLAFVRDGVSTVVSFEALTSVEVLSSSNERESSLIL